MHQCKRVIVYMYTLGAYIASSTASLDSRPIKIRVLMWPGIEASSAVSVNSPLQLIMLVEHATL